MSSNDTEVTGGALAAFQAALEIGRDEADINKRLAHLARVVDPEDESGDDAVPVTLVTRDIGDGRMETRAEVFHDLLKTQDARAAAPRRRQGTHVLAELGSFIEFVNDYKSDVSLGWAELDKFTVTVVLDEHPQGATEDVAIPAAWREHRAVYTCPRSSEWLAWTSHDGKAMKQDAFADFLEARLEDMVNVAGFPKPTEMLMLARNLLIRIKGEFSRSIDPTKGTTQLVNKTDHDTGSTEIPRAFMIAVPIFQGGDRYSVEARIRFAIGDAGPAFSYTLHRRQETEQDAFNVVRSQIAEECKLKVFAGRP